jgi:spore germination protein D
MLIIALMSCSSNPSQTQEPDYQKIKEISLDILHTADGKKALKDLLSDPELKEKIALNEQELEKIVTKSLTDEKTKKEWSKILGQPEVADQMTKAAEQQMKQLMKIMMKDPEYQKMMLDLLKDPQYSQHLLQLLKSQQYRQETMKIMEELIQVPSIQEKLTKKLQKSEGKKGKEGGQGGGEGQEGSTGQGGGGGGGGAGGT